MWRCKQCGKCCRFIVIPVAEPIDLDTEAYLEAHGIKYDGKKVIIPAVCQYLQPPTREGTKYKCMIHNDKFANCRLSGKKECEEAQKAWSLLHPND
jgi:Fe-S-cluster containining protein